MAIICRDLKLLYIMVGGTGCYSVGSVLMERFGGTLLPACPLAGIDQKHNSIKQLVEHNLVSPKELKSYFKVANARNPFDRVATQYARLHGTSWEEFLKPQIAGFTKIRIIRIFSEKRLNMRGK